MPTLEGGERGCSKAATPHILPRTSPAKPNAAKHHLGPQGTLDWLVTSLASLPPPPSRPPRQQARTYVRPHTQLQPLRPPNPRCSLAHALQDVSQG